MTEMKLNCLQLLPSLSTTVSTESQHSLHSQTYVFAWLFICFQHDIKPSCNQFNKDLLLNCRGYCWNFVALLFLGVFLCAHRLLLSDERMNCTLKQGINNLMIHYNYSSIRFLRSKKLWPWTRSLFEVSCCSVACLEVAEYVGLNVIFKMECPHSGCFILLLLRSGVLQLDNILWCSFLKTILLSVCLIALVPEDFHLLNSLTLSRNLKINGSKAPFDQLAQRSSFIFQDSLTRLLLFPSINFSILPSKEPLRCHPPISSNPHQAVFSHLLLSFLLLFSILIFLVFSLLTTSPLNLLSLNPFDWYVFFFALFFLIFVLIFLFFNLVVFLATNHLFFRYQLNSGTSSPKIRLNLCTTYNQHTTGIISTRVLRDGAKVLTKRNSWVRTDQFFIQWNLAGFKPATFENDRNEKRRSETKTFLIWER
ncbi:hypothetical protein VP01_2267g1 [Puccinia sorghi]|uniref:Uncharacterized protein n=1 Tax=Puccinia sorghi TaxID=27349 RepID=A0A0L6V8Z7_9BASI|nr:hypothetical protein VP01_2267g1 [Puccinia sorghi]